MGTMIGTSCEYMLGKLNTCWVCLLCMFLLLVCGSTESSSKKKWRKEKSYNMYNEPMLIERPTFKETERNITVGPGQRAVLRCRVENLGTKTVAWRRKQEKHPLTIGLFTFVGDSRITIDYNQRKNEWSMMIQDVRPSDEGIYQCQISSKDEQYNPYEIRLSVKTVQVSGTQYVEKGRPVQLVCNATGKPDPPHDVIWFKDGDEIQSDADKGILITKKIDTKVLISVLVIKHSTMAHTGDYICRSTNGDAGSVSVHILNVKPEQKKRGTGNSLGVAHSLHKNKLYTVTTFITSLLCLCYVTL